MTVFTERPVTWEKAITSPVKGGYGLLPFFRLILVLDKSDRRKLPPDFIHSDLKTLLKIRFIVPGKKSFVY